MWEESGHERFRRPVTDESDTEYSPAASPDAASWPNDEDGFTTPKRERIVEPVPWKYSRETDPEVDERQPGFLDRLLGRARRRARLNDLNFAIASYPDSPVNYVLRGELYLAAGNLEDAAEDFQTALSLADSEFAQSDWGLVAQSARDRALQGLRRARRR